jgi:hypothetical protein
MNWEAAGAIGEILGALAVVSSLVYLASQIRGQNREARVASVHEITEGYRTAILSLQEPEMAKLFLDAIDHFEDLEPSDRLRFIVFMLNVLRVWEDAFFQWTEKRLDTEVWESMLSPLADVMSNSGAQAVWKLRRHQFRSDFAEYIDNLEYGEYKL